MYFELRSAYEEMEVILNGICFETGFINRKDIEDSSWYCLKMKRRHPI